MSELGSNSDVTSAGSPFKLGIDASGFRCPTATSLASKTPTLYSKRLGAGRDLTDVTDPGIWCSAYGDDCDAFRITTQTPRECGDDIGLRHPWGHRCVSWRGNYSPLMAVEAPRTGRVRRA